MHSHNTYRTAGTSVVANDDGRPSLTRLGAICEQVADLHQRGIEVISKYIVSSCAHNILLHSPLILYLSF